MTDTPPQIVQSLSDDETDNSSVEEASSMNSEELWVNPLSEEKENGSDSEFLPSSYESETAEEETEEEETESESSETQNKQTNQITDKENDSGTLTEGKRDLSYLYNLMNEEVPEHITKMNEKKQEKTEEEENTEVFVCPKCSSECKHENTIQFTPCKHTYCVNCVLSSNGANSLVFQCLLVTCNSSYPASKLEKEHPKYYASYVKYSTMGRGKSKVSKPSAQTLNLRDMNNDAKKESYIKSVPAKTEPVEVESHLANVLSVPCPSCSFAVVTKPDMEVVRCEMCHHSFCFACLVPLQPEDAKGHVCGSNSSSESEESVIHSNVPPKLGWRHRVFGFISSPFKYFSRSK